jgi:very-short-patch-repair endonuclease
MIDRESGLSDVTRQHVFTQCCNAIDRSDVAFAWIEDLTAFGTIWELGYAFAKGKRVFIGHNDAEPMPELWLSLCGAEAVYWAKDPADALKRVREALDGEHAALRLIESPIERMMLVGLRWWFRRYEVTINGWVHGKLELLPQVPVTFGDKRYRLDFAIRDREFDWKIAIECDGHNFHERTPEQAQRDRERDRLLQIDGWTVLRFTGTEINRDLEKCTDQVWAAILSLSKDEAEAAQ